MGWKVYRGVAKSVHHSISQTSTGFPDVQLHEYMGITVRPKSIPHERMDPQGKTPLS